MKYIFVKPSEAINGDTRLTTIINDNSRIVEVNDLSIYFSKAIEGSLIELVNILENKYDIRLFHKFNDFNSYQVFKASEDRELESVGYLVNAKLEHDEIVREVWIE